MSSEFDGRETMEPRFAADGVNGSASVGIAGVADVADSLPQGSADVVHNTEPSGPADVANGSATSEFASVADDFTPQGPVEMAPDRPDDATGDADLCGRTEGEFCEFQYIEIVPLDSPKEAESNYVSCSTEVKEEIKEEPDNPEDVCSSSDIDNYFYVYHCGKICK